MIRRIGLWLGPGLALTRLLYRLPAATGALIPQERAAPMRAAQWRVAGVALAVALAWIFQPLLARWIPGLNDSTIAVAGALLLFILPVGGRGGRLLEWTDAAKLPWGMLILFGGGLSLAAAIRDSGLASWLGGRLPGLSGLLPWAVIAAVVVFILLLTELTSNTASAAAFLPLAGALAVALDLPPWQLAIPVALAASGAFMMPVATPPWGTHSPTASPWGPTRGAR